MIIIKLKKNEGINQEDCFVFIVRSYDSGYLNFET